MRTFATGSSGTIGRYFPSLVIPLEIDLKADFDEFEKIQFDKMDVVIHAAAIVGPSVVEKDIKSAKEVNIEGTRKLGLTALKKGIGKFVYISSSHVYKFGPEFLNESDEVSPVNEYAKQKYEGEQVLRDTFSEFPERLCIIRAFSILDWGMPEFSLGGAVEKLANNSSDFVLQNCDDIRDFLTPKQMAIKIYEISQFRDANGLINLCSAKPTKVGEAVKQMLTDENLVIDDSRFLGGTSAIPRIVGDNSKLRALIPDIALDWQPSSRANSSEGR